MAKQHGPIYVFLLKFTLHPYKEYIEFWHTAMDFLISTFM